MESELYHDRTVSLLAYSYTLFSTKYRYARTKVLLTIPTHLREHYKGGARRHHVQMIELTHIVHIDLA